MGLGFDPVSAALGVAGYFSGQDSNRAAQMQAEHESRLQQQLIDRQTKLFDTMYSSAQTADRAGQFDPTQRINDAEASLNRNNDINMGNIAASARTMGYRPGDSAPLQDINAQNTDYKLAMATTADNIRRQAFQDKQAAYGAAGGVNLNGAMNATYQQQQLALGQRQSPFNFLSSIQPFLNQGQRSSSSGNGGFSFAGASPSNYNSMSSMPNQPTMNGGYLNTNLGYNVTGH